MGARDFYVPLIDLLVCHMKSAVHLVLGGVAAVKNSRRQGHESGLRWATAAQFLTLRLIPSVATHMGCVNRMVRVTRPINSVLDKYTRIPV